MLSTLIPRAVDDVRNYEWMDGELIAGQVIGWNFGDGHLHQEQLLAAVQDRCRFDSGELRVLMVESQAIGRPVLPWRICDAADGLIDAGSITIDELLDRQPWG
jgi:hypothetical protein